MSVEQATATPGWRISRTRPIKRRESATATVDGYSLHAELDEYSVRWSVSGRLGGFFVSASDELGREASLADAMAAAEKALPKLREAGMVPR